MAPVSSASTRRATAADAPLAAACVHAAYAHYVERIGQEPAPMQDDYARVIAERQVYVAEVRGALAGVLVVAATEKDFLLENVAVAPQYQGIGVGRALLELAESLARAQGHDAIRLYTHERMTENQSLYAKIGYVEYERRTEDGFARVFMRKRLT